MKSYWCIVKRESSTLSMTSLKEGKDRIDWPVKVQRKKYSQLWIFRSPNRGLAVDLLQKLLI